MRKEEGKLEDLKEEEKKKGKKSTRSVIAEEGEEE